MVREGNMLGRLEAKYIPVREMRPNTWNPNRMTPGQFRAAYHAIRLHGFVSPVVVRRAHPLEDEQVDRILARLGDRAGKLLVTRKDIAGAELEIVDGEHRWVAVQHIIADVRAGRLKPVEARHSEDFGWVRADGFPLKTNEVPRQVVEDLGAGAEVVIPAVDLGYVPDSEAKRLTLVLNETRGSADVVELARVLDSLEDAFPQTLETLPLTEEQLKELAGVLPEAFDWDAYLKELEQSAEAAGDTTRVKFKLSADANGVWEEAFARLRDQLGLPDSPAARKHAVLELARRFLGR